MFFQDPDDHDLWHVLRWTGLPPEGEVPAFSDKSVTELMEHVRRNRLAPRSEEELLPLLVELLTATAPVAKWPTQRTRTAKAPGGKRERAARSREDARGQAAETDQARARHPAAEPAAPERIEQAVDASRRRRREAARLREPVAPPTLDEALRRRGGLFLLPDSGHRDAETTAEESM